MSVNSARRISSIACELIVRIDCGLCSVAPWRSAPTPTRPGHERRRSRAARLRAGVARVAGRPSHPADRRLAGDVASRIGRAADRLRRVGRAGVVLRLGRQQGPHARRPSDDAVVRTPQGAQRMGSVEQGADRTAHRRRPDGARRARTGRGGQGGRLVDAARRRRGPRRARRPGRRARRRPAGACALRGVPAVGQAQHPRVDRAGPAPGDAGPPGRRDRGAGEPQRAGQPVGAAPALLAGDAPHFSQSGRWRRTS